jgi:hypothetical protein
VTVGSFVEGSRSRRDGKTRTDNELNPKAMQMSVTRCQVEWHPNFYL